MLNWADLSGQIYVVQDHRGTMTLPAAAIIVGLRARQSSDGFAPSDMDEERSTGRSFFADRIAG
jgi:hypothetical protein